MEGEEPNAELLRWSIQKHLPAFPVTFEIDGREREITIRPDLLAFAPAGNEAPLLDATALTRLLGQGLRPDGTPDILYRGTLTLRRNGWPDLKLDPYSGDKPFPLEPDDRLSIDLEKAIREFRFQAPQWIDSPHGLIVLPPTDGSPTARYTAIVTGRSHPIQQLLRDGEVVSLDSTTSWFVRDGDQVTLRRSRPQVVPPPTNDRYPPPNRPIHPMRRWICWTKRTPIPPHCAKSATIPPQAFPQPDCHFVSSLA